MFICDPGWPRQRPFFLPPMTLTPQDTPLKISKGPSVTLGDPQWPSMTLASGSILHIQCFYCCRHKKCSPAMMIGTSRMSSASISPVYQALRKSLVSRFCLSIAKWCLMDMITQKKLPPWTVDMHFTSAKATVGHIIARPPLSIHRKESLLRERQDSFPTPHPTMTSFVETIRQISDDYANDLTRIAKGTMCKPVHLPPTVCSIPESYRTFTP